MKISEKRRKSHEPVLLAEVIEVLQVDEFAHLKFQARLIDATLGLGGHTREFVKSGWKVLGIDADEKSLEEAEKNMQKAHLHQDYGGQACPPSLSRKAGSYKFVHGNFKDLNDIAIKYGFSEVEAILFDLGVSVPQLTSDSRGFSFNNPEALLDMRLTRLKQKVTGADLLNALGKKHLVELFVVVLPMRMAIKIASAVIKYRKVKSIRTVGDFLEIVTKNIRAKGRMHAATLPMLALRIAVNSELEILKASLFDAFKLIAVNGRLAVISFHSGEDRIVKKVFIRLEKKGKTKIVTKKPITPSSNEISANPRSRSAKLRVIEKV